MSDPSLVGLFVRPLNQLGISYLVTGGVATVIYGEPRLTRDIDLVIRLRRNDVARFAAAWPSADFYVPPLEVLEVESQRPAHGHFNVIHHATTMRADIYAAGDDPLSQWAFDHRVRRRVESEEVWIAPIEAVILSKLRYFRMGGSDRHLRDVREMLRVSGDAVDQAELERWARRIRVEREWEVVRPGAR